MKPNRSNRPRRRALRRGFALVISLSLMVLLTVLAVGLLTLSAMSLRASGAGEARAEAEANARMALLMAIGELQTSMGPDQRVSARASSISENAAEPNMLGAWDGWRWAPGSGSPSYSEKKRGFRRWLVSSADQNVVESVDSSPSELADPVWLINPETVGSPSGTSRGPGLRGSKVPMELSETRKGAYAWAVMDESLKAPVQLEDRLTENGQPRDLTNGEKIAQRQAPMRARPEQILAALSPEKLGDPAKLVSVDSAVIAAELNGGQGSGKEILKYQADVTPYSVGLLTDTANGGFKTDLTTIFESSTASPNVNDQATVYGTVNDGAPRWDYLRSHYQLNRRVSGAATGNPTLTLSSSTDLRPAATGIIASPSTERLLPVVAKLQVMFSMVSHYAHIGDRVTFFNTKGNPLGNTNYGVPHLAYDPVVTLYNPYDVTLNLQKLRIRVWDPPVLFAMKKNTEWLRPEFGSGDFHGLARFQIANEKNTAARRFFTMYLREMSGSVPGKAITLQPGEVKVFSPWVETDWTWGKETAGGYTPKTFFDWDAALDFGNKDGRTGQTFGLETVPGWDPRAGLQADHLSYASRPDPTRYDFEKSNNWNGGWLGIKITDTFTVQSKPGKAHTNASRPDFRVDILAGSVNDYVQANPVQSAENSRDILRTYQFRFSNPTAEMSSNPSNPVISRTFKVGDILQAPGDKTVGGKTPFAILTMGAKTTTDPRDVSMPWLHNHPVMEGADQNSTKVGNALDTYDVSVNEVADFASFPNGIEIDPGSNRGFFGASSFSTRGVTNVPMFRVPLIPAASLGDLIPANLTASANLPRVTHAFGNSRSHPLIPSNAVSKGALISTGQMLDHSYLLNDALWDSTYFSTVANYSNSLVSGPNRGNLLTEFLKGEKKLLNPRLMPMLSGSGGPEEVASELDGSDDVELSRKLASVQAIQGPFNVNSDSVEAWKAFLSSLRDKDLLGWGNTDKSPDGKTGFPRATLPLAGDPLSNNSQSSIAVAGQARWAGFRALDDDQIATLATNIVKEIRLRAAADSAPSTTVGEFVNRRIGAASALQVKEGLIQTAINESGINGSMHADDSKDLRSTTVDGSRLTGIANPDARAGYSGEGAPSMLTQGDIMMALAPVITVRGDTFRVRAYGESRNPEGEVIAKAWCEAIVQRVPEYLDSEDKAEVKPGALQSEVNQRFGRRFNITSFRWLSPEEV
ncbi:hypothetical protein [Luteolibacter luteus]|uniref:Verru_Chthon cassette protein A n=1 Tax=Luteolibacter luteus TaxID=2728835 RepID=A0A858RL24_9BACT|nr:hypothetical protein [Luteolibacter luteus]QJE97301.1 hypothetical protein HHL09_16405 [Luteolibacter luteus]